jgi:uncharacterized protein (DUF2342 family)
VSLTKGRQQAKVVPPAARKRAQQAAQQLGPIAKSARDNAADRIHDARVWAAPRIEQAAHTMQENVAPRVSAALSATAHRLEPAPGEVRELGRRAGKRARATSREVNARRAKLLAKKQATSRRRWPKLMGGVFFIGASIGAVAAIAMRRNRDKMEDDLATADVAAVPEQPQPASADGEAGVDGQVRTT